MKVPDSRFKIQDSRFQIQKPGDPLKPVDESWTDKNLIDES